jgi:hypothetical protein
MQWVRLQIEALLATFLLTALALLLFLPSLGIGDVNPNVGQEGSKPRAQRANEGATPGSGNVEGANEAIEAIIVHTMYLQGDSQSVDCKYKSGIPAVTDPRRYGSCYEATRQITVATN